MSRTKKHTVFQKERLMNRNRFAKLLPLTAGCLFLVAAPALSSDQNGLAGTAHPPKATLPAGQQKVASPPTDDFAGLQYTDEQKKEIEHIRQETKSHMDAVVKDTKLTPDQKDAMLRGYAHMEYGQVYRVLTPEQQRQVLQKNRARRAASRPPQKNPPMGN